tara:strand:- start:215 stop:508 length:294 start_codon:yes stop_codon:yes gene_type:complete
MFEGRLNRGSITKLKVGEIIIIKCKNKSVKKMIKSIYHFKNFKDMLTYKEFSLKNTLPYINTLEEGVKLYDNYYTKYKIKKYGVVSIKLVNPIWIYI